MTDDEELRGILAGLIGGPVSFEELKHKPGRRRTLLAVGTAGRAVVKLYASDRAPTVAARVAALRDGPEEPAVPRVLLCDPARRMVALSYVSGTPLSRAVQAHDGEECARAGLALGAWHVSWSGRAPRSMKRHTSDREMQAIDARAEALPAGTAERVRRLAHRLMPAWSCPTVVHRDLYEDQVMVGERVGLIDLDDAALGPPELDIGNLLAHLELRALREGNGAGGAAVPLLDGYAASGAVLNPFLLDRCRRLSLLRLAGIHREPELLRLASFRGPGTPT